LLDREDGMSQEVEQPLRGIQSFLRVLKVLVSEEDWRVKPLFCLNQLDNG
jgi:hypothetical protein